MKSNPSVFTEHVSIFAMFDFFFLGEQNNQTA